MAHTTRLPFAALTLATGGAALLLCTGGVRAAGTLADPIAVTNSSFLMEGGTSASPLYFRADGTPDVAAAVIPDSTGAPWVSPLDSSNLFFVILGSTSPNNHLTIAGALTTEGNGAFIGRESDNNSATFTSGASWTSKGSIDIGTFGKGNSLVIPANASVHCTDFGVGGCWHNGWLFNYGTGNSATVSGASAALVCSGSLDVGAYGGNNAMTVSGGANVSAAGLSMIGRGMEGERTVGGGNTLSVDGSGSLFSCANLFFVGSHGSANTLNVTGGACFRARELRIGDGSLLDEFEASGNSVHLSGAGTKLDLTIPDGTASDVVDAFAWTTIVGTCGTENSLLIENGAELLASRTVVVGYGVQSLAFGAGNWIDIRSGGSLTSGGLIVGYYGANNFLSLSGGAKLNANTILGSFSVGNYADISGAGTLLTGNVEVGIDGEGNSLFFSGGAGMVGALTVGVGSPGNSASFTGSGTTLTGDINVGRGTGNTLSILDKASASAALLQIGWYSSADTGNSVTLGTGASLSVTDNVYVGKKGANNSMSVSASTVTGGAALVIGNAGTATGNSLVLNKSSWTAGEVTIGYLGSGNSLKLQNGAALSCDFVQIGANDLEDPPLSSRNSATLEGASTWTVSGELAVGDGGSENSLTLSGASTVQAPSLYIGSGNAGNPLQGSLARVNVLGGSNLAVENSASMGTNGHDNALRVASGGHFSSGSFSVGGNLFSSIGGHTDLGTGNSITVCGSGTDFSATGVLYIGYSGANNHFVLSGGASATSGTTYIGSNSGYYIFGTNTFTLVTGDNNTALASGTGTLWTVTNTLQIGQSSNNGSCLVLSDGALVKVGDADGETLVVKNPGHNFVRFSGGLLALFGDQSAAAAALLANGTFEVWNETTYTWDAASAGTLSIHYYADDASAKSATGLDGLGGFTVVSGGEKLLQWADATPSAPGWFTSWYGTFYTDLSSYSHWIWHGAHGWQYIYKMSATEIVLWDDATASWWYVNRAYYPCLYDYATGKWYAYHSGSTPNRHFWDWSSGKNGASVGEPAL